MGSISLGFRAARTRGMKGKPLQRALFSGVEFGQSPTYDAGTEGTMFVDAVNGSDGNDGTSPALAKASISAALTAAGAAGGDQVVRIIGDGVRYRETRDFIWTQPGLDSLAIKGFGTDRPVISGANILSGWTACTAGDSGLVGDSWPDLFKTTVDKTEFPAPKLWRTLLAEAGTPLEICGIREPGRTVPDFHFDNIDQTFDANDYADLSIQLRPSTSWYGSIDHPSILGGYSDEQLSQATAVMHAYPNVAAFMEVESVTGGVLDLEDKNFRPNTGQEGAYALLNVLPALEQGQWGCRDNGDGTVTFFVWPRDPANLSDRMELAVRTEGLRIYRTRSNCPFEMENVDFEMFAGGGTRDQCFGFDGGFDYTGNTALIRECEMRYYASGRAIDCKFAENPVTIENVTMRKGVGFGLQTQGSTAAPGRYLYGYRIRNVLAQDLSSAGYRMLGVRDCVMQDIRAERCSGGGHANAINFYQGCDRVAVINYVGGVTASDRLYGGYGTVANSSRFYFLHCTFTLEEQFGRGFVDQTSAGEVLPSPGTKSYLVNCWVPHMEDRLGNIGQGGITVGQNVHDWEVHNCVTPAIVATNGANVVRKGNVLTYSTDAGDPTEIVASDVNDVHRDAEGFDFRARPGSPISSASGENVETIVQQLEAWFPGEQFRRDASARAWDPASPGVGPFGTDWT